MPRIIVLAGPNGVGKSTAAAHLLPPEFPFVNADEVAKTLPNYPSRGADFEAGRLVLEQMDELERDRADYCVETTLSGRSLAARISKLRAGGYRFELHYLWSPNAELNILRVAQRVQAGGHHIPEDAIRRRYKASLVNLRTLYRPISDEWAVYETSRAGRPRLLAQGTIGGEIRIVDPILWARIERGGDDE